MQSSQYAELEFRVKVLEQGMAEAVARIGELAQALAEKEGIGRAGNVAGSQSVILDADAVSPFAAGFHAREIDASGRPFRWTGGDDYFELRFFLNRNLAWTFEMQLMSNPHVDLMQLRAFADYGEVPVEIDASGAHVRGLIPPKPFSNLITLTFHLPSCFVPSQLDAASPDNRSLGVVFYGLKLDPSVNDGVLGVRSRAGLYDRDSERAENAG